MVNILNMNYHIDDDWCFPTFQKYLHPHAKVVVIPFTFSDSWIKNSEEFDHLYHHEVGAYFLGIVQSFKRYSIGPEDIEIIHYYKDTTEIAKAKIAKAEIIYFPGGLPDKLYERLSEFEIISSIQRHQGAVIGYSAGAMIQLDEYHITPDDDYPKFGYYPGLNLVNGFGIEVHYYGTSNQKDCLFRFIKEKSKPLYAIGDFGALIIENNEINTLGDVVFYHLEVDTEE